MIASNQPVKTAADHQKNYGIEILRGALALIVVLYHYLFIGPAIGIIQTEPLGFWASYGRFAVSAFFIISGYVIAFSAANGEWNKFAASRISRLLPAAILCSTITYIAVVLSPVIYGSKLAWLSSATLLPLLFGFPYIDSVYWSIVVEVQFYILMLVMIFMGVTTRVIEVLSVMACIGAVILVLGLVEHGSWPPLPAYAALFAIGVVFHDLRVSGPTSRLMALLLVNFAMATVCIGFDPTGPARFEYITNPFLRGMLVTFGISLLFIAALKCRVPSSLGWLARWAGGVSYPLYLLHQYTGYALISASTPTLGVELSIALAIALQLVVATIVFYAIERPIIPRLRGHIYQTLKTATKYKRRLQKVRADDRT